MLILKPAPQLAGLFKWPMYIFVAAYEHGLTFAVRKQPLGGVQSGGEMKSRSQKRLGREEGTGGGRNVLTPSIPKQRRGECLQVTRPPGAPSGGAWGCGRSPGDSSCHCFGSPGLPAGKVSRATQAPAALCLHCDRLCRAPRAAHPMKFGVSAEQTGPVLWCERGAAAPLQPCLQGGCGQVPLAPSEQGEGSRSKHSLV